ncbi:MAG: RNA methyltransferase [Clostridiales bacterium]|nr:RNA methyltransferase [Clostridiales bacterium]
MENSLFLSTDFKLPFERLVAEYTWADNDYGTLKSDAEGSTYLLEATSLRSFTYLKRFLPKKGGYTLYLPQKYRQLLHFETSNVTSADDDFARVYVPIKKAYSAPFYATHKKDSEIDEVKQYDTFSKRRRDSRVIIEGILNINRAFNDNYRIKSVLFTQKSPLLLDGTIQKMLSSSIKCTQTTPQIMQTVTSSVPTPSEVALCDIFIPDISVFKDMRRVVICDSIENPDNLGMLIRTVDCFGADGVILLDSQASIFHKNCIRAARGAIGRLPVIEFENDLSPIDFLKDNGFKVYGTSAHAEGSVYDIGDKDKIAFIVGSESYGMRKAVADMCNGYVSIPMAPGQSSLNIAVAAGILASLLFK